MMRTARETGKNGEKYAEIYLKQGGYRIVERNFRTRQGEIDLIAQKDGFLAFVEVKTRESDRFAAAREFVTAGKQQRLFAAASVWLATHESQLQPRFDVIEVYWPALARRPTEIHHLENAFEC